MKSNAFLFGIVVVNVILLDFLLVGLDFLPGDTKMLSIIDILLVLLAIPGFLLINSVQKNSEKFTGRFLVVTTVQMLGFLTVTLVMIFNKIQDYKYWVMTFLVLFLITLVAQTFFLLRGLKASTGK